MINTIDIGCFISPHGFGHATRICAVLESLTIRIPNLLPHLFTTVPQSIFSQSLHQFAYHSVKTDIGLVQYNSLRADLDETVIQLNKLLPYSKQLIETLADKCRNFSFIISDIAPLGIAVARSAKIPSILIENFTWDWIYQPYIAQNEGMEEFSHYFESLFQRADYHIQTEPICYPSEVDLQCGPVFRSTRTDREIIRATLD